MDNQIIINLKEDGTIKNIETTKEQELQAKIKFKEDCLNEYADRINKALELLDSYKLGKYDYALTCAGLLEFEDILRGEDNE